MTYSAAEPQARGLDRVVRRVDWAMLAIGAIALLAMMVHITLDVSLSLLLNSPIPLTSALVTEYYMIAVAFLPLAATEYRSAHIGVDLFVNRLSGVPRRWVELVVLVLCLAVYLLLTVQSWQQASGKFASDAFMMEQTTRVSVWPSYFILPIGFGLIVVLIAVKFACRLLGTAEPTPAPESAAEELLERHGDV